MCLRGPFLFEQPQIYYFSLFHSFVSLFLPLGIESMSLNMLDYHLFHSAILCVISKVLVTSSVKSVVWSLCYHSLKIEIIFQAPVTFLREKECMNSLSEKKETVNLMIYKRGITMLEHGFCNSFLSKILLNSWTFVI